MSVILVCQMKTSDQLINRMNFLTVKSNFKLSNTIRSVYNLLVKPLGPEFSIFLKKKNNNFFCV